MATPSVRPGRRIGVFALAGLALVLVAGLGVFLLLGSRPTSTPATVASPTASATPARPPAPATTAPSASGAASPPSPSGGLQVRDLSDRSAYQFASPTGNIVCVMGPSTARCDAGNKDWTPPAPAGCQQAHDDLAIDPGGRAAVVCHTDSIRQAVDGGTIPTLAYGSAIRMGDVLCSSRTSGVTCTDAGTGDSIFLSRERYQVTSHD